MILGPRQEKFVRALESGHYHQQTGSLAAPDYSAFCVLGLCCEVFGVPRTTSVIAGKVRGGYFDHVGFPTDSFLESVGMSSETSRKLAKMNDIGMSFETIAKEVRANPSLFFTEPL